MTASLALIAAIVLPLVAAGVHAVAGWRPLTAAVGVTATLALLADAVWIAFTVTREGAVRALGGLLRADALSGWLLLVLAGVAVLACWASPAYLSAGSAGRRRSRWYGILLHLFIATMTTAVLAGNLGVLWVAIEATTIVTAFLVGHHRTRTALEAAWKYVVICSAAIAIAFLGTVLLYYAARHGGLGGEQALDFATLTGHAGQLDPAVTRLAVGLAVIGFGAKAGLVPLHAWLPDAHSQAPAPVSALMSGVLLSVALYAVLRVKAIADAALGPAFLRTLLLILALATLAVAAVLLLGQRDYKRMLAYSSMEHMGLMALGVAAGTRLAIAAVLLHIAGHGLAKTVAFVGSGHILNHHGSSEIARVRGLATRLPLLGGIFGLAMLALLGFPPAAVFASELALARAGVAAGLGWAVAAGFTLVLVCFVALSTRTASMLLGPPAAVTAGGAAAGGAASGVASGAAGAGASGVVSGAVGAGAGGPRPFGLHAAVPLVIGLLAVAALGVTGWPVDGLLAAAAEVVGTP